MFKLSQEAIDEFKPFLTDVKNRKTILISWTQKHLKPLEGKTLEKACSDLMDYIFDNEKNYQGKLMQDSIYWAGKTKAFKINIDFALKEWMMNTMVYEDCPYIQFDDSGRAIWDFSFKKNSFIDKDFSLNKTQPEKVIKPSGFTIAQKHSIFCGIEVGYLDVPEIISPVKTVKKKKKTQSEDELLDDNEWQERNRLNQSVEVEEDPLFLPEEKPKKVPKKGEKRNSQVEPEITENIPVAKKISKQKTTKKFKG